MILEIRKYGIPHVIQEKPITHNFLLLLLLFHLILLGIIHSLCREIGQASASVTRWLFANRRRTLTLVAQTS